MHDGHRRRFIEKLVRGDKMFEHEILEVLLYYAVPRIDLNELSHRIINRFGGLDGAMRATAVELCGVDGVGEGTSLYIECLNKVMQRCGKSESFAVINSTEKLAGFLKLRPMQGDLSLEIFLGDKEARIRRIATFCLDENKKDGVSEDKLLNVFSASKPYGVYAAVRKTDGENVPDCVSDNICTMLEKVTGVCGVHFFDFCIDGGNGGVFSYFVQNRGIFGRR